MEIVRSYTAVLPSLQVDKQDGRLREGRVIYLMVKIYRQGALTPWLGGLKQGELHNLQRASHQRNFRVSNNKL